MISTDKTRENRLRRMAHRQDLTLTKSRRRDPQAVDYGSYYLADTATNTLVQTQGADMGLTMDEVEHYLTPSAESLTS